MQMFFYTNFFIFLVCYPQTPGGEKKAVEQVGLPPAITFWT